MNLDLVLGLLLLAVKKALENYIVIITIIVWFWGAWIKKNRTAIDVANTFIQQEENFTADEYTVKLLGNIFRYLGGLIEVSRQIRAAMEATLVYLLLSALK